MNIMDIDLMSRRNAMTENLDDLFAEYFGFDRQNEVIDTFSAVYSQLWQLFGIMQAWKLHLRQGSCCVMHFNGLLTKF